MALVACGACASHDGGEMGSVEMRLTVDGYQVDAVSVVIGSENLDPEVVRNRTFDVSDENASIVATEGGLPPGVYGVSVEASPVDDPTTDVDESKIPCAGAVTGVVVESGETTEVEDLVLVCTKDGGEIQVAGGIKIDAAIEVVEKDCSVAVVAEFFIGAQQVSVGADVDIKAQFADGVTGTWSAEAGSIADAGAAESVYTCAGEPGTYDVTLLATDEESGCFDLIVSRVTCVGGAACGNGEVDEGEACDDGNAQTEECEYGNESCEVCGANCSLEAVDGEYCGDNIVNGAEQCDGGTGCESDCTLSAVCGDGVAEDAETCDDGNVVTESCAYGEESCEVCDETCALVSVTGAYCGDAVINGDEECDGGDGCDVDCTTAAVCGDGVQEGSEQCDDGPLTDACNYGQESCEVCSESCLVESIPGEYCGDGIVNGSEVCDGGAGCSAECTASSLYDQCEDCISDPSQEVAYTDFNEMCNGDPLCVAVKECLVNDTSGPEERSCFDGIPAECYCGIGTDLTACEMDTSFVASGPCADVMVAGVGAISSRLDVLPRLADSRFATGQAVLIIDEATRVCTDMCGFTD